MLYAARRMSAVYFALFWGAVCYVAIFIEPDMGFESMADFFDTTKVAGGYETSVAWRLVTGLMLLLPVAIAVLVHESTDRYRLRAGLASAVLILVVACLDLVGYQLNSLLADGEAVRTAIAAMLPVRFGIQKALVVMLALFAWRTTQASPHRGALNRAWRVSGWVVLALGIVFVFAPFPVPVVFFVWGLGLTIRALTSGQDDVA